VPSAPPAPAALPHPGAEGRVLGDWLLVLFTFLAALSSRLALLSIGPLLPLMQEDLALSDVAAGVLTGLPLLLMGLLAIPAGVVSDRLGPRRVLAAMMVAMAVGGGARGFVADTWAVLAATALLGAAVGLAQPAMAQVAREARAVGPALATAVYSNGFVIGALTAFGAAVPLAALLGSWAAVLRLWGAVALLGAAGWIAFAIRSPGRPTTAPAAMRWGLGDVLAIPGFVLCALVFSAQNVVFYAIAGWLPLIYVAHGWDRQSAFLPLFALETVAIGASLLASYVASRFWSTRAVLAVSSFGSTLGLVGLLLAPTAMPFLWSTLIGCGLSVVLVLTLAAPAALARPERVGAAAGVFLTLGFIGAMLGPFVLGLLRDVTGSFVPGITVLVATAILMLLGSFGTPTALDTRRPSRP
jgi:CP family cyanate transporter-like MFS transporter